MPVGTAPTRCEGLHNPLLGRGFLAPRPPPPAVTAVENQGLWLKAYEYNVYLVAFYGQHLGSGVVGRGQLFKPVDQWMENATKTIESHACKQSENRDAVISVNSPEHSVQDDELPCCISVCCCSVLQLCLTVCDTVDGSMPGLPVHHHLPGFTPTHVQ